MSNRKTPLRPRPERGYPRDNRCDNAQRNEGERTIPAIPPRFKRNDALFRLKNGMPSNIYAGALA